LGDRFHRVHLRKEDEMHAVVVRVTINDEETAEAYLRTEVVPRVSQTPGFVAGYWTRKDDGGMSMVVFESENEAREASERLRSMAPDGVVVDGVEVREVVAHA
jgi:hypothetical protein